MPPCVASMSNNTDHHSSNSNSNNNNKYSTPPRRRNAPVRLPVPSYIQLFHVTATDAAPALKRKYFRPEHDSSLLPHIRLDLAIRSNNNNDDEEERIIYSKTCTSLRPTWRHLTDGVDFDGLSGPAYESLTLRLTRQKKNHCSTNDGDDDNSSCSSAFMEIPIHPSNLIRIAVLPTQLPREAVIVGFSDDSLRIATPLYQVLMEGPERSLIRYINKEEFDHDDTALFRDTTFDVLDQVTPVRKLSLLDVADDDDDDSDENQFDSNGYLPCLASLPIHPTEEDEQEEVERVERLIRQEEDLLQEETLDLQSSRAKLANLLQMVGTVRQQTNQMVQTIQDERLAERQSQMRVWAQQIPLIQSLRVVYPIVVQQHNQQHIYQIRGLSIPSQLFTINEDELAAALGCLCHLVFLLSKYLRVALRYRLFSNASRSAVQDDQAVLYPLFLNRTARREQVLHAVRLLQADIHCIAAQQQQGDSSSIVTLHQKDHILVKTKKLMDALCDGG